MPIDITAVTLSGAAVRRRAGRSAPLRARRGACNVTQPTLSAQIKKIETTLKTQIFERSSKSVHVTPLGAEIIEAARRVLDGMDRISDLASRGREALSGPLRLGVIPTVGPYLLPWLIPPLHAKFPRLELVLRELKTSDVVDELAKTQLDAGILALPLPSPGLSSSPLYEEPFWLVAHPAHALAKKQSVRVEDLEAERILLLDEGHCLRDQALAICARAGADADARMREGIFARRASRCCGIWLRREWGRRCCRRLRLRRTRRGGRMLS
jgi:LysR family hydrogen peroxide-inducible transcriptional activator